MRTKFKRLITSVIILNITLLNGCTSPYKQNQVFSKSDTNNLSKLLSNAQSSDGGYTQIPQELGESPDIYSTYYSLKCLESLKYKNITDMYRDLFNWINMLPQNYFIDEKNNDNLSNIYFYTDLIKSRNMTLKPSIKSTLLKYVLSLQNSDGTFSMSKKLKDTPSKDKTLFLYSTYYSVEILKNIGEKIPNIDSLNKWVEENFSSEEYINSNSLPSSSYFLLLIKISKDINFSTSKYNDLISNLLNSYNKLFEEAVVKNVNIIPVINIDNVLELNTVLGKGYSNKNILSIIDKYYYKLQKDNGNFSIIPSDDANVFPTYFVIKYFNSFNKSVPNKDKLIETIQKYKGVNSAYTFMG